MGINGHVDWGEGAVRHGAAKGAGQGETRVQVDALGGLVGGQGNMRGSHRDGGEIRETRKE